MLSIDDKMEITPRKIERKKRKRFSCSDESMKPLEEVWLRFRVALPPSDMANIFHSIRCNVYQLLMRHDASLGGVLLSISNLAFSGQKDDRAYGTIVDDSPYIHFNLTAKGIVFRPRVGLKVTGIVTKVFHGLTVVVLLLLRWLLRCVCDMRVERAITKLACQTMG